MCCLFCEIKIYIKASLIDRTERIVFFKNVFKNPEKKGKKITTNKNLG